MAVHAENLVWLDLEMTGLDPDRDHIIEIATVVTDKELNELAAGPTLAIHAGTEVLNGMDEWNTRQHTSSGLWDRVQASDITIAQAEDETIDFLRDWVPARTSPMCGNSICQDRRFMYRWMPNLEGFFHYRNLDVSTIKELVRRWAPDLLKGFQKNSRHLALEDIRDSIAEMRHYRQFMGRIAGKGAIDAD
jgi:oligoribonuclease